MYKSHIIEAASFTQQRVEFNIPASLCANLKICDLGVFGTADAAYPLDPILGQLGIISKMTLRDNGQVLSQYDRRFASLMEYKTLMKSNTRQRGIVKKLYAHNYGLQVQNGGADNGNTQIGIVGANNGEGVVYPRICMDKKSLSRIFPNQLDTKLAVLDVRDVFGWANAMYSGNADLSAFMPCHMHRNMKLQIEFNPTTSVVAGANVRVAQPYLIFDEVMDPAMEKEFMNATAEWTDLELEEIFLGADTASKKFLNSFYNKTVGNLHIVPLNNGSTVVPLAPSNGGTASTGADSVNVLLNQTPVFQLGGVDSPGKRNAFLNMTVGELAIPLGSDRVVQNSPARNLSSDAANSLYEGGANAGDFNTQSNFFSSGTLSYTVLPIQAKVNSLQLNFARSLNFDASLLCWGEVLKVSSMQNNVPVVGYA
jgi:hypothetical protein